MTHPAAYLVIPPDYARALGGLCWSADRAAVESDDGRTFALVEAVASFLDGFASRRPLPHFAHALHLLYLLRQEPAARPEFPHLAQAWRDAGRPARTAGAFLASLCEGLPAQGPPDVQEVRTWLQMRLPDPGDPIPAVVPPDPPLEPDELEIFVASALHGYTQEELTQGLRHGQLPPRGGADLAREVLRARPPALGEVLAELARHERLAGAVPLVDRLVGALVLPPRRLADRQLPLGGYSDVTTRGGPEQVLPAQFALDDLEFLRRHAEHELLYYRREEPHAPTRDELVVLLDQGVRTWGRVRLALVGCTLALAERARLRRQAIRFAATSAGGAPLDPLSVEPARLAEVLAASDLTPHPGEALERVLEQPGGPRDVVLLTGPRSLDEADVRAAACRVGPGQRLFAVAVAGSGEVAFSELRHGLPVPLVRFRLDLEPAPGPARLAGPGGEWRGDLEPVPFPFRFGPGGNHEPFLFAFDPAGEWLLASLHQGLLLLLRRDGSRHEMLPRALVEGRLLTDVHGLLGVTGGFVVTGAVAGQVVAVYYDQAERRASTYRFPAAAGELARGVEWRYHHRRHALLVRLGERFAWVHLATGRCDEPFPLYLRWPTPEPASRLAVPLSPEYEDQLYTPDQSGATWRCPTLHFDAHQGTLLLDDVSPPWHAFTPLADGRRALTNRILMRAARGRDVLAVLFMNPERGKELWLFQGPHGRTITTLLLPFDRDSFVLSADGRFLALQRGACQLDVRETAPGGRMVRQGPVGRFHNNLVVQMGEMWLALIIDRRIHYLDWSGGSLAHVEAQDSLNSGLLAQLIEQRGRSPDGTQALPGRVPGFLGYDRARFRLAAWRNLVAVVSLFGEVFLFESTGELVCGFFAFRRELAAWMPDGTCWGPQTLLGRPETPHALRRIGQALVEAWQRGEGTVT